MQLNVYLITPLDADYYGCALVAASNEEEAKSIYKEDEDRGELYKAGNCYIRKYDKMYYDGDAQILIDYISL